MPEDELFEAFWPGKDPSAARRNLAVAMSLARKALDLPGSQLSVIHADGRRRIRDGCRTALAATGPDALALLEHEPSKATRRLQEQVLAGAAV